jgi:uncharacterized protein
MKLLLISDKEDKYIWDFFDPERFKDVDFVLSCGDLSADYLSFVVTMVNKPLFYVPGNHDKKFVRNPPEGCTSLDGVLTLQSGLRILGLGGSMQYNYGDFQYTEKAMAKRVNKLKFSIWRNHGFDLLVTHAPAFGVDDGKDLCHTGFQCFTDLIDKYKPKYHIHGHNHLDYGHIARTLKRGDTTIINAFGYYILDTDKM